MSYVEFANTDQQKEIAQLMEEGITGEAIAKKVGKDPGNVRKVMALLKQRAAPKSITEHSGTIPDGYQIKGTSTLYKDGEPALQWVKTNLDAERQAAMIKEYIAGLVKDIEPAKPKQKTLDKYKSDLMPSIFIGDAHIGMQASASETKHSDFDIDIACGQLMDAVYHLIDKAEPAETGLLVNVGDLLHANGRSGTTLKGTPLDVDKTFYTASRAAGMFMRYTIDSMLEKFGKVYVVIVPGNHDGDPAVAIQLMLDFYYDKEPRVVVLKNEGFCNYIEYGNWLLGMAHGDKQKPEALVGSMARDMSAAWGRTTHRMWCTGHFHKESVKTLPGCKHKVFGALPPPDSWHASQGYLGDGEMEMLTFRKEGGLHSSHVYNIPQPKHEPDVKI